MKHFLLLLITFFSASMSFAQTDILWQHAFGGSADDLFYDIKPTADKGYIVCGTATSVDGDILNSNSKKWGYSYDYWVEKFDSLGTIEWQKFYGTMNGDQASSIAQTKDGGYILCGMSTSNIPGLPNHGFSYDVYVIKTDDTGGIQWQNLYGGTGQDRGRKIVQTSDGGYIFIAMTDSKDGDITSNHGGEDMWVVKLTGTGSIDWQKCYGGTNTDRGYSIKQTKDGGYIFTGTSYSSNGDATSNNGGYDMWLSKIDKKGTLTWQHNFGGDYKEIGHDVIETSTGDFVAVGATQTFNNSGDVTNFKGETDFWVVKTNSSGALKWQRTYGGTKSDSAFHIIENTDGNYIVAGFSSSPDLDLNDEHIGKQDMWFLGLEPNGNIKWNKAYGGTEDDIAFSVAETPDKGYLLAGITNSTDFDATKSGFHPSADTVERPDGWVVRLGKKVSVATVSKPDNDIKVYPTFSTHIINIELPTGDEQATAQLLDMTGKKVNSRVNHESNKRITVTPGNIPTGTYLLQVRYRNNSNTFKVVYTP